MSRNYPESWRQKDRDELDALIAKARDERKWLYCNYQNLWFSPDKLVEFQAGGQFWWGAANWSLRNPMDRLEQFDKEISVLMDERKEFERAIVASYMTR